MGHQGSSEVVRGHPRASGGIRGHNSGSNQRSLHASRPVRGSSSEVIRGHQGSLHASRPVRGHPLSDSDPDHRRAEAWAAASSWAPCWASWLDEALEAPCWASWFDEALGSATARGCRPRRRRRRRHPPRRHPPGRRRPTRPRRRDPREDLGASSARVRRQPHCLSPQPHCLSPQPHCPRPFPLVGGRWGCRRGGLGGGCVGWTRLPRGPSPVVSSGRRWSFVWRRSSRGFFPD